MDCSRLAKTWQSESHVNVYDVTCVRPGHPVPSLVQDSTLFIIRHVRLEGLSTGLVSTTAKLLARTRERKGLIELANGVTCKMSVFAI